MTRVSLKEAYDNKDVVAQIFAIRDIAEGAEDTADSAVTTANTASEHVDALVPQVEGAVANANQASASAQASAQTVAGYENRLSTAEGEIAGLDSDLGAVELRVTTAEGQIVTIQGRVTALESADVQNVKLAGNQAITGIKTVPTEATGSRTQQIANSNKIGAELDNYAPMVRTTGNAVIDGVKSMRTPISGGFLCATGTAPGTLGEYIRLARVGQFSQVHILVYATQPNNGLGYAELFMGGSDEYNRSYLLSRVGILNNAEFLRVSSGGRNELWLKRPANFGRVDVIILHTTTSTMESDVMAGTGLTTQPVAGDTNPITSETITGVSVLS